MSNVLTLNPSRALTVNITAAAGATATFYHSGTTTLATVYADVGTSIAHPNPLSADASGVFAQVFAPKGVNIKAVIRTAAGATLYTLDPVAATDAMAVQISNGEIVLDSITAISENDSLTYSAGAFQVSAGNVIRSALEGVSYEVAASGATGQHVLTGGGVKLSPLPRHDGFVTAQQCGISTAGDQTAAVQAWMQWAADNGHGFDLGGETFTVSEIAVTGDIEVINGKLISNKIAPDVASFQADVAFEFGGTEGAEIAVSTDFEVGADRLVLASVTGIEVGDLLHLNSTRLIDTDHRGAWTEGQVVRINRISGNTVYLDAPLCYSGRASTVVTGTISGISGDRYTLTVNNVLAGNGRDRTAKITITSGTSSGETRYCIAASATTLRHSGSIAGEWDRLPWPAGVQIGDSYEHAWRSTVTIIKPAKVIFRDVEITRAATFTATAGDFSFRGLRIQYADEPLVERCKVQNFSMTNIHLSKCYRPTVRDCDVSGANLAHDGYNGTGYGVSFEVCSQPRIYNSHGQACRRVVDVSGSSGYSEHGLIDGVVAYGGGRTYEGLDFWPTGTQQQSVAGSHGSGRFTEYRNCVGIDTYLGVNLRGRTETVSNYAHWGYGKYAININHGCGHVIDGVSYSDKFTEEARQAAFRQTISTSAAKRLEAVAYIDWADTFAGNVTTTIRNVRASAVSQCGLVINGAGAAIKNLVMSDWHLTASNESGSYSDFTMIVASVSATLDECHFSDINMTLASGSTFSGVMALFGIPGQFDIASNGKIKIDGCWHARIEPNAVIRFPCRQNTAMVDLVNARTGLTRPRCAGLILQDMSATTLNVSADKTLLDVLATYPADGTGVTAGSFGINLNAAAGFVTVASNAATAQTFRIRVE